MKKAFTLLELLISITLFSIIVVFLYKTLDQTKHSNNLFSDKEQALKESNHLYNIFLEDITESSNITITSDKNKNSIIKIVTNNTYHNAFFNNITYLINSSKKLVRIESYETFDELQPMTLDFETNSYIDILLEDIEYFDIKNMEINYNFIIKQFNKDRIFYNTYQMK
jgi:prepilin-type N-terminal cleavage/methylation domain-containing protein